MRDEKTCELIGEKVLKIGQEYNKRTSIKAIADKYGMSIEEVRLVLNYLGYWHGIDRLEEPTEKHSVTVGRPISDLGFLLKYSI